MKNTLEHSKMGSDIDQHLIPIFSLVLWTRAKVVMELGVRTGESTIALAEGVHATEGHLYSVDIEPCEEARRKMVTFGLLNRWTFILSDDIQFGMSWPRKNLVDLVFVDSSHLYDHTKREIEVFEPLLRPGGVMAFHDTVSNPDGVLAAVLEFQKEHSAYQFENLSDQNGLGVLRKPWKI